MATIATAQQYADWAMMAGLTEYPPQIQLALERATAEVQGACGREFLPSPATVGETEQRVVRGDGGRGLIVPDILTLASVSIGGGSVASYTTEPASGAPTIMLWLPQSGYTQTDLAPDLGLGGIVPARWTEGVEVTLTGRFGYAEQDALPPDVVEACCILAGIRLMGASQWPGDSQPVKRETVLSVTTEYAAGAHDLLKERRAEALAMLRPFARMF